MHFFTGTRAEAEDKGYNDLDIQEQNDIKDGHQSDEDIRIKTLESFSKNG